MNQQKTKVLFVNGLGFGTNKNGIKHGGGTIRWRNLNFLYQIFGEDQVDCYQPTPIEWLQKIIQFGWRWLRAEAEPKNFSWKKFKQQIEQGGYEVVWFDNSFFGQTIKKTKQCFPNLKIVTHFHNVESQMKAYSLIFWLKKRACKKSEKLVGQWSDQIVVLSERDKKMLMNTLSVDISKIDIVPISLPDRLLNFDLAKFNFTSQPYLLFVGNLGYKFNLDGLSWLIEKVMSQVSIKLKIVGLNSEKYRSRLERPNVEVVGELTELKDIYLRATAVVVPIFGGGGMKVKVAEALSYGKIVLSGREGGAGYELGDEIRVCENALDWVKEIKNLESTVEKFNFNSRKLFLEKYSDDVTVQQLSSALLK